jgi:hypothetical protein
MITKEDCRKYFKSLITEAVPKGQEGLSAATIQYLQYLVKNYKDLDEEMKILTDKMLDESVEVFSTAIAGAVDSPEVRQAKRLLRNYKDNRPTAKGLIAGLEQPSQIGEPFVLATRSLFEKHLQYLIDTLFDVIEVSLQGSASFVKLSMFYSCINELICAFYMAQRGYASQAYTHVRTVLESLNLVELINLDEKYADLWTSNDEKNKMNKLSPKAVRKKLGRDKSAYSFFSEHGAHPTMGYVNTYTAKRNKNEDDRPEITFWLGGTKWAPHLLWANSACIYGIEMMLVYIGVSFESRVHHEDYPNLLEECFKDFNEYLELHLIKWQKENGIDTSEVEALSKMLFSEFQEMRKKDNNWQAR